MLQTPPAASATMTPPFAITWPLPVAVISDRDLEWAAFA